MTRIWDPYAKENIVNPYQMYDRMRSEAPVFRAQTGEWIITKYEDVFNLLGHKDFHVGNRLEWMKRQLDYLKDDRVDFQSIVDAMNSFLVLLNPPQHTRVRAMLTAAWNDHEVEGTIKIHIDNLLGKAKGDFDVIDDFAMPLPVMTISSIMGIEVGEYRKMKSLSERMIQSFNLYTSLKELVIISKAAKEFIQFFKEYIHYRRKNLGTDLVSKILIQNADNPEPLTDEELISTCIFLFVAGEETTVNLIGNGVLALQDNLPAWEDLVNDPEKASMAVNEILRYDSPVQLVGRIASKDYELGGHLIPKNSAVTLMIGAANRDAEKFDHPHQFNLHRTFKQHLAFGRGKHFCLGAWLAKLQGELALKALVERYPNLRKKHQELKWNDHLAVRGLSSLMMRVSG